MDIFGRKKFRIYLNWWFFVKVWSNKDYLFIKESIQSTYPYGHYFKSGLIGSGCCVFSKHPIMSTFYHSFSLNGYFHQIHRGDWLGDKLVGLVTIDYFDVLINVYVTHVRNVLMLLILILIFVYPKEESLILCANLFIFVTIRKILDK